MEVNKLITQVIMRLIKDISFYVVYNFLMISLKIGYFNLKLQKRCSPKVNSI